MKRSKFSLSHYRLLTTSLGTLTPLTWYEALPGDSIQQRTNLLIRMTPLTAPVMHPVKIRLHTFFVPNRLIWEDWEDFITGGEDGKFEAQPPTFVIGGPIAKNSLMNYMGIPAGDYTSNPLNVSALPFRALNLIFNEYYRDQDLTAERALSVSSGGDSTTVFTQPRVAWEKDYMTTARPNTSKGDEIFIPIGLSAPVVQSGDATPTFDFGTETGLTLQDSAGENDITRTGNTTGSPDVMKWAETKLIADLQQATGISVNDLRDFLAQQRFQEARQQFGSRYSEYLKYIAPGIGNLDARLQEPEYLGGGKGMISFSEILQTQRTDTGETPLGTMGGHAIATMRTRRFRRFIPEHGIIMTLMSVVPKAIYASQIERKWHRLNKEMYFQKELQYIGEQPIINREVHALDSNPQGTFGYQQRYDDYRYIPSSICGDFSDLAANWHYARLFESDVALNNTFIECNPANRPSAESTTPPLYIMANHSIQARRILTKWPKPRTF